jgi:Raf kinase inhibitor-like YbhB/YbcL family protein
VPALLRLSSPDFEDGSPVPERCAHHKDNLIPTLQWSDPPEGTVELAILMEDADTPVGTWDHWAVAGIGPSTRSIEGGKVPEGAVETANDFGEQGYGGPEPPPGDGVHRYFFNVYALKEPSGLSAGATADDLRRAVVGKEIARGVLIGTFER